MEWNSEAEDLSPETEYDLFIKDEKEYQCRGIYSKDEQKRDSEFDHGGYFLIKGAEKIFIVQEQICLRRLWVSNIQGWTVA
ncbi:DNA-directed RNA polymerases IV and V subunit 2, partial [Cucurbita argyrosperma subsp. sororia]